MPMRSLASVGPAARQRVPAGTPGGPILEARGVTKRYGGLLANRDINFSVQEGELRGVIGPNGAGKSTFFKMLTCEVHPTSGGIASCSTGATSPASMSRAFASWV